VRGYKRLQERGDFSPLSVFIVMRLLKILKENIILLERLSRKHKIFPAIKSNNLVVSVFQTEHQKTHRNGDLSVDTKTLSKIADGEWKTGVNSNTVKDYISKNLKKIIQEFLEFGDLKDKRILFVDEFKNPLYPNEEPTYVEYVLEANKKNENVWELEIITSAHSLNGKYLKSLKNDKVINLLENMMYNFDKIVLLY